MDEKIKKAINVIRTVAFLAGVIFFLAFERLAYDQIKWGLSRRLGFDMGWLYLGLGVMLILYIGYSYWVAKSRAAELDQPFNTWLLGFISLGLFAAGALVAGLYKTLL